MRDNALLRLVCARWRDTVLLGCPVAAASVRTEGKHRPVRSAKADEVLQRPVQMAADGAVQVEGDGDE